MLTWDNFRLAWAKPLAEASKLYLFYNIKKRNKERNNASVCTNTFNSRQNCISNVCAKQAQFSKNVRQLDCLTLIFNWTSSMYYIVGSSRKVVTLVSRRHTSNGVNRTAGVNRDKNLTQRILMTVLVTMSV